MNANSEAEPALVAPLGSETAHSFCTAIPLCFPRRVCECYSRGVLRMTLITALDGADLFSSSNGNNTNQSTNMDSCFQLGVGDLAKKIVS